MCTKQFIYLDSSDYSFGSEQKPDFSFSKILGNANGKLTLDSCIIPNSFYQINNLSVNVVIGSAFGFSVSGWFTANSLSTYLQTTLNSYSSGFTVSFNSNTLKYTISNSTAFTIEGTLIPYLGITDGSTSSTSHTSSNASNVMPIKYLYLRSNALTAHNTKKGVSTQNISNIFAKVAVQGMSGDIVEYNNLMQESSFYIDGIFDKAIDLYWTDKDNNIIDFRGVEWSLVFSY